MTRFLPNKLSRFDLSALGNLRLGLAVSLSIILHLFFLLASWRLQGTGMSMADSSPSRLEARLRTPADFKLSQYFVPEQVPVQALKPLPPTAEQTGGRFVAESPVTNGAAQKTPTQEPVVKRPDAPLEKTQPDVSNAAPGLLNSSEDSPPSVVELELDLFSGSDGKLLSRARATYTASAGRYVVAVESDESQGIASTTGERWRLQVMGSIRQAGLYPEAYSGEGVVARQLVGHENASERMQFRRKIQDGLFDNQSLFYQFMHLTKQQMASIHVASTDGSYRIFEGRIQEDEVLEVQNLGALMTNRYLFNTQGSSETFEVWLLPGKRVVPLRVRHTSAEGKVLDQRVRTLRTAQ